jgi:hypothetical protein
MAQVIGSFVILNVTIEKLKGKSYADFIPASASAALQRRAAAV